MKKNIPTIVIVGRPNVGKSLLFNRLIEKRQALVHNAPGMTLDYIGGDLKFDETTRAHLIDTGGVYGEQDKWTPYVKEKMEYACRQADFVVLVTDAQQGKMSGDEEIAAWVRSTIQKEWVVVVNKAEGMEEVTACSDFLSLGCSDMLVVSAKHGTGFKSLKKHLQNSIDQPLLDETPFTDGGMTSVAIVGRPNVGKSSLTNRLLRAPRMVVSKHPGTTRDSVSSVLDDGHKQIKLIDTAGMKRRSAISEWEKLAVVASRRSLKVASCALLVVDAVEGVTHQDKRIAHLIDEAGCALVIIANKADLLPAAKRHAAKQRIIADIACNFTVDCLTVSATTATGFPHKRLLASVHSAAKNANSNFPTSYLNQVLQQALDNNPPHHVGKFRPKLRFMHQSSNSPIRVVIHGNSTDKITATYRRYLINYFGKALSIVGAPIRIAFKTEDNPYV